MRYLLIIMAFFIVTACNNETQLPEEIQDNNMPKVSENTKFLRIQDSILRSYAMAVRLINQIDDELTRLANVPNTIETQNLERDILQKIEYLAFQLKTKNEEIEKLQRRVKSLSKENSELTEQVKTLEAIIAEKDVIIQNQKERISSLEQELKIVVQERDYALEGKQLAERVAEETINQKNTAFYVIGTEEDLENKKLILMEGEGFLGIGGKYVPSPDANLNFFKKIDIISDTLLQFPNNFKIQEIVSSHNKKLMEVIDTPTGEALLKIKNPEIFWQKDKTLVIIVEKK